MGRWIALSLVVLCVGFTLLAQEGTTPDSCDSPHVERMNAIATGTDASFTSPSPYNLPFAEACVTYNICTADGAATLPCTLELTQTLESSCPASDSLCQTFAFLLAQNVGLRSAYYLFPDDPVLQQIEDSLKQVPLGSFDAAIEAYRAAMWSVYIVENYVSLARLDAQQGNLDMALAAYRGAIMDDLGEPIVYIERMNLLQSIGETEQASLDAEWLRRNALRDASLAPYIQATLDSLPLDLSQLEQWNAWLLESAYGSPAGGNRIFEGDTLPKAVLVNRNFLPNTWLVMDDVADTEAFSVGGVDMEQLNVGIEDVNIRVNEVYFDIMPRLRQATDNVWAGTFTSYSFESSVTRTYLFAPADAPDPRLNAFGFRCEDGRMSNIGNGETVFFSSIHPISIHDAPEGNVVLENITGAEMKVVSEGVCTEDTIWWQADLPDYGVDGWFSQGVNSEGFYPLFNTTTNYLPFYCPNAPAPRLRHRQQYQVVVGTGSNNLRSAPALEAPLLVQIPEGTVFSELSTPVCADDIIWWQVTYEGQTGWTAEGQGDTYFLEPIGDVEKFIPEAPVIG